MSSATTYPHLWIDEAGIARLKNSRYKVVHLAAEHFHYGWSAEEILRQHPDLRPEEVYASLTYFYDHYGQLVKAMEETAAAEQHARGAQPLSRAELLKRKPTLGAS